MPTTNLTVCREGNIGNHIFCITTSQNFDIMINIILFFGIIIWLPTCSLGLI